MSASGTSPLNIQCGCNGSWKTRIRVRFMRQLRKAKLEPQRGQTGGLQISRGGWGWTLTPVQSRQRTATGTLSVVYGGR